MKNTEDIRILNKSSVLALPDGTKPETWAEARDRGTEALKMIDAIKKAIDEVNPEYPWDTIEDIETLVRNFEE